MFELVMISLLAGSIVLLCIKALLKLKLRRDLESKTDTQFRNLAEFLSQNPEYSCNTQDYVKTICHVYTQLRGHHAKKVVLDEMQILDSNEFRRRSKTEQLFEIESSTERLAFHGIFLDSSK